MIQEKKCSWSSFNQAVCGLRFLYTFTLPREWVVQMIPFGNRPKKLPIVLGQSEVHRKTTASQVESTLARIDFCRTAPLGGRTFTCKTCESQVSMYNSCGDRHCPQCSGARHSNWLDKAAKLLLPDITYFQVVFTLPDKLSSLVLGNRRQLYSALMRAAAESLEQVIASECGMKSAALVVLHTWNQKLGHHPHVHALVPGSGPSLDGNRWVTHRMTKRTRSKPARPLLVDYKRLSAAFQEQFMSKLKSLHRRRKLALVGTVAV